MSAVLPEDQWNDRANGLRRARAGRYEAKNTLGGKQRKKAKDPLLRKANALERVRNGGERSPLAKYDIVPPVKPKFNAFERTLVDDDSWGEASEDSDVEDFVPRQKGQGSKQPAFPLPPMSFALVPVQYPGSVGYKQTPPKNAKRKDYLRRKSKPGFYQNKGHSKRVGVSIETQTDEDMSVIDHYQRGLEHLYRDTPSPVSRYIPNTTNDPRYKYIHASPTQSLLADDQRLLNEAAHKFRHDPRFANRYVEEFITSELQNEVVPDLLIDVLSDVSRQRPALPRPLPEHHSQPLSYAAAVRQPPYYDRRVPSLQQPFHQSFLYRPNEGQSLERTLVDQADMSIDILEDLITDFVRQQSSAVVREACAEYVNGYLNVGKSSKTMDNMMDGLTAEVTLTMFDEVMKEASDEVLLERDVINPVVDRLLIDIATEALIEHDTEVKENETQQLSKEVHGKLLDGMMLDYLLDQVVKQERIYLHIDAVGNYTLDGIMLDVLLRRIADVERSQASGIDVKPVRRYHERIVTDVVMELLLNELCLNLDEDMKDFDEYESGLTDYLISKDQYGRLPASAGGQKQ